MARTLCRVAGVVLLLIGLVGFAAPGLLGMHLTPIHNVVHLLTAAMALYFGFAGSAAAARSFCIAFGAIYLLLGVLGLAAPDAVAAIIGHGPVSGGELMPDHIVHRLLGAVFLGVGLTTPRVAARA